jgi:hypothetical protein
MKTKMLPLLFALAWPTRLFADSLTVPLPLTPAMDFLITQP